MPLALPQGTTLPSMAAKDREEYLLAKRAEMDERLRPCGVDYVRKALSVMAAMLRCDLPPTQVLVLYMEQLKKYPIGLIDLAVNEVLNKHRYPTFPLLADITLNIKPLLEDRQALSRELDKDIELYVEGKHIEYHGQRRYANKPKSLGAILQKRI